MFKNNRTEFLSTSSRVFGFFLAGLLALVLIWFVASGVRLAAGLSVLGILLVGFYFLGNFEKAYFPFIFFIILPVALFVTAIPGLRAFELVIPGIFILFLLRQVVLGWRQRQARFVPKSIILFFAMGLASFLRHPSLPAQVFAAGADPGNFRVYWNFFLGLMTYVLTFHLFREGRRRKTLVLVRLMTTVCVSGLILQFIDPYLRIPLPLGEIFVHWGPYGEAAESGGPLFRGWAVGWFGLFLFLVLISFSNIPKNKLVKSAFFLLSLAGIILSGARSILLAAVGTASLLCLLKGRIWRLLVPLSAAAAILAVSYFYPQTIDRLPEGVRRVFTIFPTPGYGDPDAVGSALVRVAWWTEALEIISRHPLVGIGFERIGVEARYLAYADYAVRIGQAHSAYIATGVMLGLPGIVVLAWIFALHLLRGIILSRQPAPAVEQNLATWLTLMVFGYNIIFFFAGAPQVLYSYFLFAGLINLTWIRRNERDRDASHTGPPRMENLLTENGGRPEVEASGGNDRQRL